MPRLEDVGVAVVSLDQQAALVVGREVHRADQAVASALADPGLSGAQQSFEDRRVVLGLDESELPVAAALELVPAAVDLCGDPPDGLAVSPGEEILGLSVLEVGVLLLVQELTPLEDQRGNPRGALVEPEGQLDELAELCSALDGPDLNRHARNLQPRPASERAEGPGSVRLLVLLLQLHLQRHGLGLPTG